MELDHSSVPADRPSDVTVEQTAGRTIDLGKFKIALIVAIGLWLVSLVLPQIAGVKGYEVLLNVGAAQDTSVKITERVFAVVLALGLGVLSTVTLITRRVLAAAGAWMLCTVGVFFSLLALWLRQTRPLAEADVSIGVGFFCALLGAITAVVVYSFVVVNRADAEKVAALQRASKTVDHVAEEQLNLLKGQRARVTQETPFLEDDRRRQAAERRRAEPHRSVKDER